MWCAREKGVDLQWVQLPPGKGSLQPVAIGAATSVTMLPKPLMERIGSRFCEQAGRNVSERRAGLENFNVGADPPLTRGRPLSWDSGERHTLTHDPTGVMATACLHQEIGRNTGDLGQWVRDPTGRPRGTGPLVPSKPGNAGGGKGPDFGYAVEVPNRPGIDRKV